MNYQERGQEQENMEYKTGVLHDMKTEMSLGILDAVNDIKDEVIGVDDDKMDMERRRQAREEKYNEKEREAMIGEKGLIKQLAERWSEGLQAGTNALNVNQPGMGMLGYEQPEANEITL